MAGAGIKEVKNRIHSIESTRQITNAMQLVASSKLRRARSQAQDYKEYFEAMYSTLAEITRNTKNFNHVYLRRQESKKKCYIVLAGDRGLAGGYNSNVFKEAEKLLSEGDKIVAIGKKSVDYFTKRQRIMLESYNSLERTEYKDVVDLSEVLTNEYKAGEIGEIHIIYTEFISALTQEVKVRRLLPLSHELNEYPEDEAANWGRSEAGPVTKFEPSVNTVLDYIIPRYMTSMIYGGITQSFASEQGARRTAMEAATDNADAMLSNLELLYNRARQSAVTQEITEIVGGVEALK